MSARDVLEGRARWDVTVGDCVDVLCSIPDGSINCVVTSPPYWGLRDYGVEGQLGLESTPEEYVAGMVRVLHEVRRVLRDDGTLWLNLGDSYASTTKGSGGTGKSTLGEWGNGLTDALKNQQRQQMSPRNLSPGLPSKNLVGIPWRVAFALQADGWILRSDIIWHKPNPMPESVTDRPTKAHEYLFLLAKSEKYFYDADAGSEAGVGRERFGNKRSKGDCADRNDNGRRDMSTTLTRNRRSVWTITPEPFEEAHFATYPTALVRPCVEAGCPVGGVVFDPFTGSGTTGLVANNLGRRFIGAELNPTYAQIARDRLTAESQGQSLRSFRAGQTTLFPETA